STLEIEPGAPACWRNGDAEEALFVADGQGDVFLGGNRHFVGARSGVFVRPGEAVAIESSGTAPMTLLHSRCPDSGPAVRFEQAPPAAPSKGAVRAPSQVVRFEDRPTERAGDGRWFRVLLDKAAGCEEVTQFVGFIPPGRAPEHFHEYEEVVCILE